MPKNNITIVVPVYGDWPSLKECIESLQQHTDPQRHKVLLANDCGPEVDEIERNIRKLIKGSKNFMYHRNSKNLGFVGNCNNAVLKLDETDNDIVLLNSDTKTTAGFLDEMSTVLYSEARIGTVSPRSNNATICTFPISAIRTRGLESMEEAYTLFHRYSAKLPRHTVAPTGHGFCMMIRRSLIKEFGLFDTAFGKGYGEEVDFCRRIQKAGWQSVIANHAFVFHLEARSFSLETKKKLIESSRKIIDARYPEYKAEVTRFIAEATAREAKLMGAGSLALRVRSIAGKGKRATKRLLGR